MPRRPIEPEEAIEPALDGLGHLNALSAENDGEADEAAGLSSLGIADTPAEMENNGEASAPVALIFGSSSASSPFIALAASCGFKIVIADLGEFDDAVVPPDSQIIQLADYGNIVNDCNIERDTYVCIFNENETDCELILSQCLASDAYYIGLGGSTAKVERIFAELKSDGAPDAELAAVAAPMGLNVGAIDPDQQAVAIVAEMLAAKSGKLKKLRSGHKKI